MRVRQFELDGLGHLSALVADDDAGVAAVVDPRRDVDVYLDAAAERDLRITHVLETHLHNDYVSGARELASLVSATHVIGLGATLAYEHRGVRHGDEVTVGALRFTALETPGHTPEHVAYAVADTSRANEPALLFTGGSLLVGAVGRTDLLGVEHAAEFARAQFRSLHDVILRHEDHVTVLPTHGAGSLCSTGISSTPSSTLGYERRHNAMLRPSDIDEFARVLLSGQPTVPRYFARMRPTNQQGPRPLGADGLMSPPIPPAAARDALVEGAVLVDARSPAAHAAGHVPGSLSIPRGSSFGTWLGWVVDPDRPIVLLLDRSDDADDLVRQALRVGHDAIAGHVQGGFRAWADGGLPTEPGGVVAVHDLAARLRAEADPPLVLDVRQPSEYESGHVPGAVHIGAGELPDRLAALPRDRPIVTVCASGYRSSVAASLLRAAGFRDVAWASDGLPAWRAAGLPVETGDGRHNAATDVETTVSAGRR